MFRLKVIQALYGDCLIVEGGAPDDPRYLLIDGGPSGVYQAYLKPELTAIRDKGGQIQVAVLSHVDDDHVNGLLDLLHDLIKQRRKNSQETIAIDGLWHNSFGQTLGSTAEKSLARQMDTNPFLPGSMPQVEKQARSISQGQDLAASAQGLKIPMNADFRNTPDRVVCVDNLPEPVEIANLKLMVVGPTRDSLHALQVEWEAWLEKQKQASHFSGKEAETGARELDKSVPNLSSIMLLVEAAGKTMLLAGDGRGDQLLEGLQKAGVLREDGSCHVNIFKLAHHGSARNVTPELFAKITADTYVISANGKDDNPDFQTLEWLVQAADKQGRTFTIVATNETASTKALVEKYKPAKFHYAIKYIEPKAKSITIDLS